MEVLHGLADIGKIQLAMEHVHQIDGDSRQQVAARHYSGPMRSSDGLAIPRTCGNGHF